MAEPTPGVQTDIALDMVTIDYSGVDGDAPEIVATYHFSKGQKDMKTLTIADGEKIMIDCKSDDQRFTNVVKELIFEMFK